MKTEAFFSVLDNLGAEFYTGVPDSLLTPFIDEVMDRHGISNSHIVAANEGAAVGLAAGHYLATGKPAVVYMQNSGIGNTVNPICSLLHEKVYAIPAIFVIGWRGEPGIKDEPQHVFQGEATLPMLDCLQVPYIVVSKDTDDLSAAAAEFKRHIASGQSVAFVISKGALENANKQKYTSDAALAREDALKTILDCTNDNAVYVCTTGKLSREIFEIREQNGQGHEFDFLTVGSMGHSLMIAYGIALARSNKQIYCLDGDGAVLMHMGSLAVVGAHRPENLTHIVMNNGAHETVGGLPTVGGQLNFCETAKTLGYAQAFRVECQDELAAVLARSKDACGPILVEVICNLASRADLGRPTTTPIFNKNALMDYLKES
ncbi:MAG: phosphonopyruvate decarboxylase [Oscillospiraceae bacterium]|nr:phosphonopyruvate decarboxylase [Oscillospiraceae bacterium]